MSKWILVLVCLLGSLEAASLYTSQDRTHMAASIKECLSEAQESILILTFSLSDPDIIQLINQKAVEGVAVTVVIDKAHLGEILKDKAPSLEIVSRHSGEGHLHHKILIVDHKDIWVGSANFTTSAYTTQENMMVRFESRELAEFLYQEADVFRGGSLRSGHGPIPIALEDQELFFCLLPHDGFPPKPIEKSINEKSKQLLLEKIKSAKRSLKIAMMVWTNYDLTQAVIAAYKRGVDVQIVSQDFGGTIPTLISNGLKVTANPKFSLMHNKLMCIDGTTLVNGSANWSQSSFTRSDESFVILEPLTEEQNEAFENYWSYLTWR